ncbi:DUF6588 family protein [Geofilum rubicundum]|uniref:Uncharacterized protein n=1 Tax=Geofilum rubicundum JCM 15548 TaxID=1236989 RepID=A0A0E9LY92_9BACT|nr:DUF6588 family protein [Geofilum rubicundum]GAO30532.1 hypothetical protein JCM15548_12815 [Geofilum rubicundum JCM 15548]
MYVKKSGLLVIAALLLAGINMRGQKSVTEFLEMGVDDAKIMSEAYLRPYGEMLGKSLNGGWYNSAGVHKIGGFDVTFGINMAMVPAAGKNFDVSALNFNTNLQAEDPNLTIAPTIAGEMPMSLRPRMELEGEYLLTMPNGTGFDKLPAPMAQVAVGLPFHSEVSVRFMPSTSLGDAGKVNLYGFGIKHSIKEYIPFLKRMPFIRTSVMLGYTNMGSEIGVDYGDGANQSLDISSSAFTSRLLVGVNIPFLAVYTGMGYGSTNSDFALKGDYGPEVGTDPFTLGYATNGFDFNAGLRLRFGFIALHGDYTFGDYSMVSAGIGINFR